MHYNYKFDEQSTTNKIKRHLKSIEKQRQIKHIIYYAKFKTSNLIDKNNTISTKIPLNQNKVVYKFICPFREYLTKSKNINIGYTTTTLSRRLTYHFSENSAIKQHLITKHDNCSDYVRMIPM